MAALSLPILALVALGAVRQQEEERDPGTRFFAMPMSRGARELAATAKESNVLTLRGGLLEGKPLTGTEVDELATLPPVDVLRGQLVGAIVAPLTQLTALLTAPLRDLHGLIDARIAQLGDSAEAESPNGGDEASAVEAEQAEEQETPAGSAAAEPAAQEAIEELEQPDAQNEVKDEEE